MRLRCGRYAGFCGGLFAAIVLYATAAGQAAEDQRMAFDVAPIRPAASAGEGTGGSSRSQIEVTADGLTMRSIDLSERIEWAYGLQHYRLEGTKALAGDRYDIRARAGDRADAAALKRMIEDLLATRFKLQIHRKEEKRSVCELTVAGSGALLPKDKSGSLPRVVDGGFVFSNVTMGEFAQQLTELRGIDLPVVDRTGIQGVCDITQKGAARAILDPQGPSLLTLINEQLGLKLPGARDPVEVVVADHAEKPSAD